MKKYLASTLSSLAVTLFIPLILFTGLANAAPCQPGSSLLGLPTWYKYLDGQLVMEEATGVQICQPALNGANDIWKIVAAALEILLRVGTLIAIGFVVYGGVTYIISQGAPDKTKQALQTIINALVGLVISIIAAALVGFIAGRF